MHYHHFPLRRGGLPPRQHSMTECSEDRPTPYPRVPPLELSSMCESPSYVEDPLPRPGQPGSPCPLLFPKPPPTPFRKPQRPYDQPSNSDRFPQKPPPHYSRKESVDSAASSLSATHKLQQLLCEKYS